LKNKPLNLYGTGMKVLDAKFLPDPTDTHTARGDRLAHHKNESPRGRILHGCVASQETASIIVATLPKDDEAI